MEHYEAIKDKKQTVGMVYTVRHTLKVHTLTIHYSILSVFIAQK